MSLTPFGLAHPRVVKPSQHGGACGECSRPSWIQNQVTAFAVGGAGWYSPSCDWNDLRFRLQHVRQHFRPVLPSKAWCGIIWAANECGEAR